MNNNNSIIINKQLNKELTQKKICWTIWICVSLTENNNHFNLNLWFIPWKIKIKN